MDENELDDANLDASTEEAFLAAKASRDEEPELDPEPVSDPEAEPTAEVKADDADQDDKTTRLQEVTAEFPELVARLKSAGVTEAEMLSAVDAQVAKIEQDNTRAAIEEKLSDVREELKAQVAAGELTQAAAQRLWEAEWNAAVLAQENEKLRGTVAQTSAEKAVERVQAEFPNAPLASLRKLAARGWSEAELKEFAAEQEGAVQAAIQKQAAAKTADQARAHVPKRGAPTATKPQISHEDSFEDIFASRKS